MLSWRKQSGDPKNPTFAPAPHKCSLIYAQGGKNNSCARLELKLKSLQSLQRSQKSEPPFSSPAQEYLSPLPLPKFSSIHRGELSALVWQSALFLHPLNDCNRESQGCGYCVRPSCRHVIEWLLYSTTKLPVLTSSKLTTIYISMPAASQWYYSDGSAALNYFCLVPINSFGGNVVKKMIECQI